MISATGLTKRHATTTELAGIDLSIARGECVGIAGSVDSGRTALMRILATLVPPSEGRMMIGGLDAVSDVYRVRRLIAYAGAVPIHANRLRVVEHLRFVAGARRQPASTADAAADLVGLRADAPIDTLSDDSRARLSLASAIVSGAKVLLLDDVFRALDAAERDRIGEWLADASERGTTILVATDDEDIPTLCQRVIHLQAGRIADAATIDVRRRVGRASELVSA